MTVEQASADSSTPLVALETRNFADLTFSQDQNSRSLLLLAHLIFEKLKSL